MPGLKGTKTEQNLKDAFATESQANQRYLYFKHKAGMEGLNTVSGVFRSIAEAEARHAIGHLEFLAEIGDPATGQFIGPTSDNLKAAIANEADEYAEIYPQYARTARREGFTEIADWFEAVEKNAKSHAEHLKKILDTLA
jgi:rubrerythrin